MGLGLSVTIITHDISREIAHPFVARSVRLLSLLLLIDFFDVASFSLFLGFRETVLISVFGMFSNVMLVRLNISSSTLESGFTQDTLKLIKGFLHLCESSSISDDSSSSIGLLLGSLYVGLGFCHF